MIDTKSTLYGFGSKLWTFDFNPVQYSLYQKRVLYSLWVVSQNEARRMSQSPADILAVTDSLYGAHAFLNTIEVHTGINT